MESAEHDFRIYNTALNREFYCFSVVQRLASSEDDALQGMAGKKTRINVPLFEDDLCFSLSGVCVHMLFVMNTFAW